MSFSHASSSELPVLSVASVRGAEEVSVINPSTLRSSTAVVGGASVPLSTCLSATGSLLGTGADGAVTCAVAADTELPFVRLLRKA